MMIELKHVQKRQGHYRYRRKIPAPLRVIIGKGEIVIPLGSAERDVLSRYAAAHRDAERLLEQAAVQLNTGSEVEAVSAFELYRNAKRRLRELGFNPAWDGRWEGPDDPEGHARSAKGDEVLGRYPEGEEGEAIGITPADEALVRLLFNGEAERRPDILLSDAKRLYVQERVRGKATEVQGIQRAERAVGHVLEALGHDPALTKLSRTDARSVRDHMLKLDMSAATVRRYLNDVKAMINHALTEFDLRNAINPFNGLEVKLDVLPKEARQPFSDQQLIAARRRVLAQARGDLQLIWRILESTGCRLAEVAGLLASDVLLEHDCPHLSLVFHSHRRLKNKGSVRKVPLIGDALEAARTAKEQAGSGLYLFPAYAGPRGSDAVSAALMKHVRAAVADPKVVVHSLRHTVTDWLRLAGATVAEQDLVLGRSAGRVGEAYGGDLARLRVASGALAAALKHRPQ